MYIVYPQHTFDILLKYDLFFFFFWKRSPNANKVAGVWNASLVKAVCNGYGFSTIYKTNKILLSSLHSSYNYVLPEFWMLVINLQKKKVEPVKSDH